ncbi:MAG: flavodoxin family protein [Aristaeellaceae bacterium]
MKEAGVQARRARPARSQTAGRWLLFWTLFIGIGAVAGASGMLLDPTGQAMGMDAMLPYFQVLPLAEYLYQDFLFPGFALLVVNGLTNLTAAALLVRREKTGVVLGGAFGVTLMLWICIQFLIFPLNVMSTSYFIFGLCQAVTGFMTWVFCRQEAFQAAQTDAPPDGTNGSRLVVYFSRMGYVRRVAYEAAGRTGAQVYEIRAKERTEGTAGFWWCGRFAMHRWAMPVEMVTLDLAAYDHVTICTPVWVFSLASPVRAFCRQAAGKIREADYILVHHTGGSYASVAAEMDRLLGVKHTGCANVRCRMGKFTPCPSGGDRPC